MLNNTSVLPFYKDKRYQLHRQSYANGDTYKLVAPLGFLPSFQIHTSSDIVEDVRVMNIDDELVHIFSHEIQEIGIDVVQMNGFKKVIYRPIMPYSTNLLPGGYYLILSTRDETFVSEVFYLVNDVSCYTKIDFSCESDIYFGKNNDRGVYFQEGFKHTLYLDTQVGKPAYSYAIEREDRLGYPFTESIIAEKVNRFSAIVPEYVLDVMRVIVLCDSVTIYSDGRVYKADSFLPTERWLDNGNLASVDVEFKCDTIIKRVGGRCDVSAVKGDFNNDFNNDFSN